MSDQWEVQHLTLGMSSSSTSNADSAESTRMILMLELPNVRAFVPDYCSKKVDSRTAPLLMEMTLRFVHDSYSSIQQKLDDGWPESVEEQGLLLLVWRHHITNNILKMCYRQSRRGLSRQNSRSARQQFASQTLLHTEAFTHRRFYTQKLLHTKAFTDRHFLTQMLLHRHFYTQSFYPQKLLQTEAFTHIRFYTHAFTHRHFYTLTLWHTDTFNKEPVTHRSFYTQTLLHTNTFTHRDSYTQRLLYPDAFTHRRCYTQSHRSFYAWTLWHTATFTQKHFYIQTLLHTKCFTHKRFYTQSLLHTDAFRHRRFHTQAGPCLRSHSEVIVVVSTSAIRRRGEVCTMYWEVSDNRCTMADGKAMVHHHFHWKS